MVEPCFPRDAIITFKEPVHVFKVLQTTTLSSQAFSVTAPTLAHLCSRLTLRLYFSVFRRFCDASEPCTQQFPLPRTSSVLLLHLYDLFYFLGPCLNIVSSKDPSLTLEDGVRSRSGVLTSELHLIAPMAPIALHYGYLLPRLYITVLTDRQAVSVFLSFLLPLVQAAFCILSLSSVARCDSLNGKDSISPEPNRISGI